MNIKCPIISSRDEAPEQKLFALDKLQMSRQIVQDETAEDRLFNDELQLEMLRVFVQDEVPEHGLFAFDKLQMPKHLSMSYSRVNSKCPAN
jgi:hypothetical protein